MMSGFFCVLHLKKLLFIYKAYVSTTTHQPLQGVPGFSDGFQHAVGIPETENGVACAFHNTAGNHSTQNAVLCSVVLKLGTKRVSDLL